MSGASSQGLSPGAIGGIVGGIVGGLIILGLFLAWFIRRTINAPLPQPPVYQETTTAGEKWPVTEERTGTQVQEPWEEVERPVGGRLQGIPEGVEEERPGGRVVGLHYY